MQNSVLQLELKSTFKGPSFRDYPIKYYIKDFNVGIVGAKYIITLKRGECYVESILAGHVPKRMNKN